AGFQINTMPIVTLNFLGCNISLPHHTPPRYTGLTGCYIITNIFGSGSTLQEIAGKEDSSSEPSVYRSLATDAPMSSSKKSGRRLRQSPEIAAASQIAECLHSDTSSFRAFAAARCQPRFYPCIAERCLALQISGRAWMDTGGLCWPALTVCCLYTLPCKYTQMREQLRRESEGGFE
ncbi:hypothetical protein KUCAC02_015716, partial [Chaenocephalus aceratus]